MTSKVIAILLTFANGSDFSLTEIARLAGLPVSTAHRLTSELVAWGMLERTPDGQYQVGMRLRAIATAASPLQPSVHERARRVLEDLADAAGRGTVRLGVLDDLTVAFIEKTALHRPVSMVFESSRMPVHASAMGKALLAFSPPDVVERIIARGLERHTRFTVTSPDRLRRALSTTRLTCIAMARRELELTSFAIAVPVFGPGGQVVAALEVTVSEHADLRLVRPPLVVAGRALSRELQDTHRGNYLIIGGERQLDLMISMGGSAPSQRVVR